MESLLRSAPREGSRMLAAAGVLGKVRRQPKRLPQDCGPSAKCFHSAPCTRRQCDTDFIFCDGMATEYSNRFVFRSGKALPRSGHNGREPPEFCTGKDMLWGCSARLRRQKAAGSVLDKYVFVTSHVHAFGTTRLSAVARSFPCRCFFLRACPGC